MKLTARISLAAGLCLALAASSLALALGDEQPAKAKLGKKAPDFTLTDSSGVERSLSDYEGRLVVLEWINPDCPFVQRCYQSKSMQKTYERVRELNPKAVWLAVNTTHYSTAEQNNGWIKTHELKYPILLDPKGEVGRRYSAKTTPHMFVIDEKGILRYHGAIDNNKFNDKRGADLTNYVVNAVRQVVDDETVSPDFVKSWGCTVKYAKKY
jgi:peroxiredoxin